MTRGKRESLEVRFWSKVKKGQPNECWEWLASVKKPTRPYGNIWVKEKRYMVSAHRVSWIIHYGEIPDGMCVCHTCDNPRCVNPSHLFLGTNYDNVQDKMKKGRHRHIPFKCGDGNPATKYTQDDFDKVIDLKKSGMNQYQIADFLGISQSSISRILNNQQRKKNP